MSRRDAFVIACAAGGISGREWIFLARAKPASASGGAASEIPACRIS